MPVAVAAVAGAESPRLTTVAVLVVLVAVVLEPMARRFLVMVRQALLTQVVAVEV
jgi:hypothetical protein